MATLICGHEKRRNEIILDLQNLDLDKAGLQCEIDQIDNHLEDIKEKLEENEDLNYFIKLEVENLQKELMDEVEYLNYMMDGLESKDAECVEMYNKVKKEAVEENCSCINKFKTL